MVAGQLGGQDVEVWPARPGVVGQAAQHQALQPRRHRPLEPRRQLPAHHRVRDLVGGLAGERPLAVQRLVERHAQAELVGQRVGRAAAELLRRHVRRRPEQDARGRAGRLRPRQRDLVGVLVVVLVAEADQAEVDHADPAVAADQDVVGLDVAVDEAGRVRRRQAARRLGEHRRDLAPAPTLLREPCPKGHAGDELHGDEHLVAVEADLVDLDHVRVRQLGQRLGLAQQPILPARVRLAVAALQQLDRDLAVELRIVGRVDHSHRPGAEAAEQREATDPSRNGGRLVVPGLAAGTVVGCPKGHTGQPGDSDARAESGLPRA
ncbi:hypothetical protein OV079_25985 [Nannocystis pusilla]|uniref:Uncharacterized protein n=1 Tax=Nannocystis pusilla TaxID=889268 RepID=A0A9X3ES56_9BACT|nr:hypothetical protein [Nannocystis pusilla]MCY1008945.1 hypothetical protein [Nannocystis pusilla]